MIIIMHAIGWVLDCLSLFLNFGWRKAFYLISLVLIACGGLPPAKSLDIPAVNQKQPGTDPIFALNLGMHSAMIMGAAVSRSGRWAVTVSVDKTGRVWDLQGSRETTVLRPPIGSGRSGNLYAVAISPNEEDIAVGGFVGWEWELKHYIYIFDRRSGSIKQVISGIQGAVFGLAFSGDGAWLAATLASGNGGLLVISCGTRRAHGAGAVAKG